MRHLRLLAVVLFAAALAAGCGKSEEQKAAEKAAEEAKEAAEALQKAAEKTGAAAAAQGTAATAQGLQEFAKAMEGMAGALAGAAGSPDGKPVTVVSFQELQTVLPEVSGWTREKPTGERMTSPIPFSQAEADYQMGDAQVSIKIVDSAFSQALIAPWAMFLAAGYEKETSEGYEKSVNIGGNPGFETWDSSSKHGALNLFVAKRFLLSVEGNGINDTKVLNEFVSRVDTGKLASLK